MANFLINDPKCVFIHIPKTAGTSIRRGFFNNNYEGPTFREIPINWQNLFKFAFVRNPYDRFISAWKMFSKGVAFSTWEYPHDGEKNISIEDFWKIVVNDEIIYDERRNTFEEKIRHHTIPQTHEFNCLAHADFVGRFENLNSDFKVICKHLGAIYSELPYNNKSKYSKTYRELFSPSMKKKVQEYYYNDFKLLDYDIDKL